MPFPYVGRGSEESSTEASTFGFLHGQDLVITSRDGASNQILRFLGPGVALCERSGLRAMSTEQHFLRRLR